ncbi:MAG: autotransporter domain-containing protein, partial [Verrucomicrobia bacterium]|nr:autotransporter domain-containing protein [Verrucomicrobiota bacterium]
MTVTPSSLTIINGTSFATNGNSVTTPSILGPGTLILGGSGHTVDTLIITGPSNYSGNITDSSTNTGSGAVQIEAAVTFSGTNTFSSGLYLVSGNLTISAPINSANINVGSGTIYGQGGGITISPGNGNITSISNDWVFEDGTNTTFNVSSGSLVLNATSISLSSSGGSASITITGGGNLTISEISGFSEETGGTYTIDVASNGIAKSTLSFNANGSTTMSAHFIHDGVLHGHQKQYFALADALPFGTPQGFRTTPVTLFPPVVTNIIVENNAVLLGSGSVTHVDVLTGGGVAAGDLARGNLTVTEDIIFNEGTRFITHIEGDGTPVLMVLGEAIISSNVDVRIVPTKGRYEPNTQLILSSGTLTGRFAGISIPSPFFLDSLLDYSVPNQVFLTYNPITISRLVTGSNALAVAHSLDTVIAWNRTHVSYDEITLEPTADNSPLLEEVLTSLLPLKTQEEMTDALNQLQPAFLKGFTIVQEDNIVKVQDTLSLRMDYVLNTNGCYTFSDECCKPDDKVIHTWISGMGDVLAQDSNTYAGSPQIGYQSKMGGFTAGVDGHFAKVIYLGGIGGYTNSHIDWKKGQGTGNINTGYAGVYLSALGKMFYGNLSVIGGFSNFSSKRHIEYTGVDLTASGKHTGRQILSHADTGVNWSIGGFTIRPFDGFDYISGTETAYTEEEAGEWDLSVNKTNSILLRNELGLEVSTCLCFSYMKWVIAPKASWIREIRVKGATYTAAFAEATPADAPFTVTGYFPNRSLFSPGVSLTGSMCQDRVSVQLNYNGVFTGGY